MGALTCQQQVSAKTAEVDRLTMSRTFCSLAMLALFAALVASQGQIDPMEDAVVPEEHLTEISETSSMPKWFEDEVAAIRVADSASVFTTKGLWDGIQEYDKANPEHAFFGNDENINKVQLAAFLGNVAQETGGLKYPQELDHKTNEPCSIKKGNCAEKYGKYFGRGALQVTCWEGQLCANYLDLEKVFGVKDIANNPGQVATNPLLAWGSAILYWTTNKGFGTLGPASKYPPMKDFGGTYATINGGQECPPPTGGNPMGVKDPRVANRIAQFKKACKAADIDCDNYNDECPVVKLGICDKKHTWDCQNDADCGDMKPCIFVPKDQLPENKYNQKTCSNTADSCTADSDCGTPVFCGPLQGKCSNNPSKDCKDDSECGSIKCNCQKVEKRCKAHNDWGCGKDEDCGDPASGAKCLEFCASGGLCSNHPDWGCKVASDCGDVGYCGVPKGDRCSNHPDWACKAASDCDPPKCY